MFIWCSFAILAFFYLKYILAYSSISLYKTIKISKTAHFYLQSLLQLFLLHSGLFLGFKYPFEISFLLLLVQIQGIILLRDFGVGCTRYIGFFDALVKFLFLYRFNKFLSVAHFLLIIKHIFVGFYFLVNAQCS